MAEPTQLPSPRRRRARRELRNRGRQLGAAWARLTRSTGALRRSGVGLGLLSSAITLACGGVVVVAYVYLTSAEPLASSPSAQPTTGPILRAVDLGGRLRGQQSTLEASR